MDESKLLSHLEKYSREAGMPPDKFLEKAKEVLGSIDGATIGIQACRHLERAAQVSGKVDELKEKMRNGARRTKGSFKLPV